VLPIQVKSLNATKERGEKRDANMNKNAEIPLVGSTYKSSNVSRQREERGIEKVILGK
jgi:hypothetical protein